MLAHVAAGDLIGDTLVAESFQQPIEDPGRVVPRYSPDNTGLPDIRADII
jgi:hypothetical protein